jgi:hypothetical protein
MWRKRQIMIHTDEDDEFERIERENQMKGQPYYWEADAIKAAVLIEREACARIADSQLLNTNALLTAPIQSSAAYQIGVSIRARGQA